MPIRPHNTRWRIVFLFSLITSPYFSPFHSILFISSHYFVDGFLPWQVQPVAPLPRLGSQPLPGLARHPPPMVLVGGPVSERIIDACSTSIAELRVESQVGFVMGNERPWHGTHFATAFFVTSMPSGGYWKVSTVTWASPTEASSLSSTSTKFFGLSGTVETWHRTCCCESNDERDDRKW